MVRKLQETPVSMAGGVPADYYLVRDVAMHDLGIGSMHNMRSVVTGLLIPSLLFPEYSLSEKYFFWKAKARWGISILWKTIIATDLTTTLTELEIPAYFVSGALDMTCSYEVSKEYYKALNAPLKGFYTFDKSAHSPLFEEPEKLCSILKGDVLQNLTTMADR
jgi:pimeloyl-ACP methyl ester carboxylesterase